MMYASVLTALGAVTWFIMTRTYADTLMTTITGWVTVSFAGLAVLLGLFVGHSGAESVWVNQAGEMPHTMMPAVPPAHAPMNSADSAPSTSLPETGSATSNTTPTAPDATAPAPIPVPTGTGMTMAEVTQHNNYNSCYTVINDNVYNLTE